MNLIKIFIALPLMIFVHGCSQGESSDTTKRLNEMSNEIEVLKTDISSANKTIEQLKSSADMREIMDALKSIAYLRPGDEGYSVVSSDLGVLTIQMTDIKPYANGSKVAVKFGNPLSASIDGLKAKVEWGKVDTNGVPLNATTKSKGLNVVQTINAGAWSTTSIVLDDIPPAELGFVRISGITHTGIRLVGK